MLVKDPSEKRETTRLTLNSQISIVDEQQNKIEGKLQDLSATGISVATDKQLALGSICNVSITMEGDKSNLVIKELIAKVIRFDGKLVALEFTDNMEWLTLFYVYKNKFDITNA